LYIVIMYRARMNFAAIIITVKIYRPINGLTETMELITEVAGINLKSFYYQNHS